MLEFNSADSSDFPDQASNAPAEPLTVERAIANLQQQADPSLRYYAAWWLGKFLPTADCSAQERAIAIAALEAALEDEVDQTELGGYPLRRNAARALGKLADLQVVPHLIRCLDCSDYYVREAAAQSLGLLGDPSAIPALQELLRGGVEGNAMVPGRPHLVQPVEAAMEALGALNATDAVPLIEPFLHHSLSRIQHAAARALYILTQEPRYGDLLIQALSQSDLKNRRAILLDLGASGYLAAAETITGAAVENSFKLFALKSLLENHLKQLGALVLSADAQRVMHLMDSLL